MAQTKKKRRRKHRGTQGGRIDTRPARGRARSRAEAQNRARSRGKKKPSGPRTPQPPSWGSATKKGLIAAALFMGLMLLFKQSLGAALLAAALVGLVFYIPGSYLLDRFMYERHLRKERKQREERQAQKTGGTEA